MRDTVHWREHEKTLRHGGGSLKICDCKSTVINVAFHRFENVRSEWFSIQTSEGRAPASELVLLRGGLASKIELQGGSLESKIVYRGIDADFEKPKIYLRLTMTGKYERACLITLHSIFEIFKKGQPAVEIMLVRRIFER